MMPSYRGSYPGAGKAAGALFIFSITLILDLQGNGHDREEDRRY
jgi:hypothetical protein